MSLFKARAWWATLAGENEEFDNGCLCVANIDNSSSGNDKIIVGSYHGSLRIFNPQPVKLEGGGWSGFKPEDVMLETHLQLPILQVEAGKFVSASENIHLAVLHPRKLAVYSVTAVTGAVEHGSHCQLNLMYEQNLKRTCFNMCYGPFGGVKGKDFICVQSMDGTLSVFEQESFAFSRFLPGALLPGPIRYVARTDSFVTVSSSRQVESYKYQVLAVATDDNTKESQAIKSGKRVAVDWTYNIGEQALDISVPSFAMAPPSIYILGERNLFCISDVGKLRYMKKFDFNPSCFIPYTSLQEGTINYMIGSHTSSLLIYQDVTLKWAAQLQHIPVDLKVGNFQDLKGVVVTLDEYGHVDVSYMGTDPALFVTPKTEAREINYDEQDQEMKNLQKTIKEQSHKANVLPTVSSDDDIQIQVQVSSSLDEISRDLNLEELRYAQDMARAANNAEPPDINTYINESLIHASGVDIQDEDPIPSISAKLTLKAKSNIQDLKVSIHAPLPLAASQTFFSFPSLDSSHPGDVLVSFFLKNNYLPHNLNVGVTATYQNVSGAPRVAQADFYLPIKVVIKPCMPVKMASYKVTIDTNKPPVNLNDLFPDLLGENAGGPGNALGFQFFGGPVITVLASKTSQRYRLQCDVFEALYLMTAELVQRLTQYFAARRASDFQCSFAGSLPLGEYFECVDAHFELRLNDAKLKELLGERATQFRAIQRRLLTRFKDKTPSPLANLDTLLDGTYRQLLALGEAVEDNRKSLERVATNLSSATKLLNLLIKLWSSMSDKEFKVLEASLSPRVIDGQELGWEESVDGAITHLLRTCLSKNAKDQTVNPSPLSIPKDTTKLKKHIALVCDRLNKGAKLMVENGGEPEPEPEQVKENNKTKKSPRVPEEPNTANKDENPGDLGEAAVPLGSQFGEKKKSPRASNVLNGELPSLNGPNIAGALPPLKAGKLAPLAPLGENKLSSGLNDLTQKKKNIESLVPDLDDMDGSVNSRSGLYDRPMSNGHRDEEDDDIVAM